MKDIDFIQVDLFVHWYFWLGVVDGSYLEKVQKSMFYFQMWFGRGHFQKQTKIWQVKAILSTKKPQTEKQVYFSIKG